MKRIQIASIGKRILSTSIDLVIAIGITCLFYFCVFYKAVSNIQHFDTINETIRKEQLDSKLYVEAKGNIITITQNEPDIKHDKLEPIIKTFYVDFMHKKDGKYTEYWYNVHVLYLDDIEKQYEKETITRPETILYEWKDGVAKKKDGVTDNQLNEFYRGTFGTATVTLSNSEPIKGLVKTISLGKMRSLIYASLVGTVIPYLVFPLILKNSRTIGKQVCGLVVLTDEGYYYKRWKNIVRYISLYIIEIFGAVITIGLTLIFTSCLVLFSKKRRALHDFIAFSVVADGKYSVFFKDEEEENKYREKNIANKNALV